ncbi:hypothetical protein [Vibrio sp. Hep-1b-8]|uniref:hypothetical protein n=1 Tax=Vibrio sp. Hep-1b-8 TaxID=2144187 RepID=UPI00110FFA6F|nr:hypothetical protein [Vibrio sp. Hep-1b-8]TMX34364.1 hypothetical protein DA100_15760 [Vibrio sp. Hep-1b-8]
MSSVEIRFCTEADYHELNEFLAKNWSEDFSVVRSKQLFDFLYKGHGSSINFVIAKKQDRIVACLGLTFYNEVEPDSDVFLSLWRSVDDDSSTGVALVKFVMNKGYRSISSVGVRKDVLLIYKLLGFDIGKMTHSYRLNNAMKEFDIFDGDIKNNIIQYDSKNCFRQVNAFIDIPKNNGELAKTIWYLNHRYFSHPSYQYLVFAQYKRECIDGYIVVRPIDINQGKVLRLVDIIGDVSLPCMVHFLDDILKRDGYEYFDLYSHGINSLDLVQSGLTIREDDEVIVPNYFEPFLKQNEDKYYFTNSNSARLFKGDGDADRPYRLIEVE